MNGSIEHLTKLCQVGRRVRLMTPDDVDPIAGVVRGVDCHYRSYTDRTIILIVDLNSPLRCYGVEIWRVRAPLDVVQFLDPAEDPRIGAGPTAEPEPEGPIQESPDPLQTEDLPAEPDPSAAPGPEP